jgi:hypothetical protein
LKKIFVNPSFALPTPVLGKSPFTQKIARRERGSGIQRRISIHPQEPAEREDPNPSILNPNGCKQSVAGKVFLLLNPLLRGNVQAKYPLSEVPMHLFYSIRWISEIFKSH